MSDAFEKALSDFLDSSLGHQSNPANSQLHTAAGDCLSKGGQRSLFCFFTETHNRSESLSYNRQQKHSLENLQFVH